MSGKLREHDAPTIGAVVVLPKLSGTSHASSRMEETCGLVEALQVELGATLEPNIRKPNPATLLGGGQLEQVVEAIEASASSLVIVDATLTPIQQRNLENRLQAKVIDRTGLILEIFGLRARTAEGRLQVELARQLYERSRLVRTWTHLERQRGGHGFLAGPGETQIEADRRMLDRRIKNLRRDIEDVRRSRRIQRAGRQKQRKPIIALVGYTNAGKSTLFNRLTGAQVLARDMPFATLDPTVRELTLSDGRTCVLIDTVGFITDLPSHLIAAFRATLEEVQQADLLVHVRDIAHPDTNAQAADVSIVLDQIFADADTPQPATIEVWNKFDALTPDAQETAAARAAAQPLRTIPTSAQTGQGLDTLVQEIEKLAFAARSPRRIELPSHAGALLSWLHDHTSVESQALTESGDLVVDVNMSDEEFARFEEYRRQGA